jgi:hypothetical protein
MRYSDLKTVLRDHGYVCISSCGRNHTWDNDRFSIVVNSTHACMRGDAGVYQPRDAQHAAEILDDWSIEIFDRGLRRLLS